MSSFRAIFGGIFLGTLSLTNMVLWWILIGVMLASLLRVYVPESLIWSNIGRRSALWLPAIAVAQILLLAWAMNVFLTPVS